MAIWLYYYIAMGAIYGHHDRNVRNFATICCLLLELNIVWFRLQNFSCSQSCWMYLLPLIGVRKEQQLQQGTEIWDIFISWQFATICISFVSSIY